MYACLIAIHCKPGRTGALLSAYENVLQPLLDNQSGFGRGALVMDTDTHKGFILNVWETKHARHDAEAGIHAALTSSLLPNLAEEPQFEDHDVLVDACPRMAGQFARVITLPVRAADIEAARAVYEDEYLPLLQRQPGFLGVIWLADQGLGTGWGISFWSSRDEMQAADRDGEFFPKVLARLAPYFSRRTEMGYYAIAAAH